MFGQCRTFSVLPKSCLNASIDFVLHRGIIFIVAPKRQLDCPDNPSSISRRASRVR